MNAVVIFGYLRPLFNSLNDCKPKNVVFYAHAIIKFQKRQENEKIQIGGHSTAM